MKPIEAEENYKDNKKSGSWADSIARSLIFRLLGRISIGHLTIVEEGAIHRFGDAADQTSFMAEIKVNNTQFYRTVLLRGTIGAGEAYMDRHWTSPDLLQVIRLMSRNMGAVQALDSTFSRVFQTTAALKHWLRRNTSANARQNIARHYDLGNDFFECFLDPTMLYSSAVFPEDSSSLEQASRFKMHHICERLNLQPDDHLLEIGSGWGGLAIFAARHFGCRVTSVTLSREQHKYAQTWVEREGLTGRVEIRLQDYRDISGKFDKIVSIEMLEAVGHQYYATFFQQCSRLLKESGLMLLQVITIVDQRYCAERDRADFIQHYIFPGGSLPSTEIIAGHVSRDTNMQLVGLQDITNHYARTLAMWRLAFLLNMDRVRALGYDETFIRMWDFYLNYCEGGFRERVIGAVQYLLAKPLCRQLPRL